TKLTGLRLQFPRLTHRLLSSLRSFTSPRRPLCRPSLVCLLCSYSLAVFFFNDPATTEIYTLSLHDALPILFLMSSLMLLLVWLIFFMVLIKLLPILGTISGKTVKLMVLALICLGNNRQD